MRLSLSKKPRTFYVVTGPQGSLQTRSTEVVLNSAPRVLGGMIETISQIILLSSDVCGGYPSVGLLSNFLIYIGPS